MMFHMAAPLFVIGDQSSDPFHGYFSEPHKWFLGRVSENKSRNRGVPSVYHGLVGTNRERLKLKGFRCHPSVHRISAPNCNIALKTLAIPAGFEPATHAVEIRYSFRPDWPCGILIF